MRRHTEDWLAAVFAAPSSARARDAAYGMSTYADWETGLNCWASATTVAKRVNRGRRTIQRGFDELEALGFIQRTGINRPQNCTDYALVIPTTSCAKVGATSSAKVGATDLSQLRQFGPSVAPNQAISSAKVGAQPPHTSSDQEEEGGGGSALAPAPDGAALPLDGADAPPVVADYVTAVKAIEGQLRQQWPKRIGFHISGKARAGLRALIDAGWQVDQLLALVAECGTPKSNAGGLLAAHFAKALELDPADYTPAPTDEAAVTVDIREDQADDDIERCEHGIPKHLPKESCLRCHELSEAVADALRYGESMGFTFNRGRRDSDGDMNVMLLWNNVQLEFWVDRWNVPFGPTIYVDLRNPNEAQLGLAGQFDPDHAGEDERGRLRATISRFTYAEFAATLIAAIDVFAATLQPAPALSVV